MVFVGRVLGRLCAVQDRALGFVDPQRSNGLLVRSGPVTEFFPKQARKSPDSIPKKQEDVITYRLLPGIESSVV